MNRNEAISELRDYFKSKGEKEAIILESLDNDELFEYINIVRRTQIGIIEK